LSAGCGRRSADRRELAIAGATAEAAVNRFEAENASAVMDDDAA